jgi:hypothetical protein
MCKALFEEHHWHTIAIAITKAKVKKRDGSGADAPWEEKAIAKFLHYIGDLLENNYMRER